jgi:hypothetical protein
MAMNIETRRIWDNTATPYFKTDLEEVRKLLQGS